MHAPESLPYSPDAFAGDPPLSDDEKRLAYTCDPKVDYYAVIDAMQPPWVPPTVRYVDAGFPTSAAFSDASGPREVRTVEIDANGRRVRRTKVMPHKRYVRAIDRQGNLCSLIVSTCRPDKDKPTGDDGLETMARVIARKSRLGWIVVERDEDTHNPFAGRTGQDYAAWALEVMGYRRRLYGSWYKGETSQWYDEKKAQKIEEARLQGEAMGEALKGQMRDVVREATAQARRKSE